LILAIALFLFDTLVSVYLGHSLGVDFLIRLVVLIPMALGLGGIKLQRNRKIKKMQAIHLPLPVNIPITEQCGC